MKRNGVPRKTPNYDGVGERSWLLTVLKGGGGESFVPRLDTQGCRRGSQGVGILRGQGVSPVDERVCGKWSTERRNRVRGEGIVRKGPWWRVLLMSIHCQKSLFWFVSMLVGVITNKCRQYRNFGGTRTLSTYDLVKRTPFGPNPITFRDQCKSSWLVIYWTKYQQMTNFCV